MADFYVTPTLLNNWLYYMKSLDAFEDSAKTDFFNCLNKVKTPPTANMQRGIDFENAVWQKCLNPEAEVEPAAAEIAAEVQGGLWQEVVMKELNIGEYTVLLYGKADVIKEDTITDIKRVNSYDIGKYLHSVQHKIYLYCTGLPKFVYHIAAGKQDAANSVFKESYTPGLNLETDLIGIVNSFVGWLKANDAFEVFLQNWNAAKKTGGDNGAT